MANEWQKNFDDLLTQILQDYQNLDSSPDVSYGSIAFIDGSVLAATLVGLYRYQDFIARQEFPDTADTDGLNHWGAIYGITRLSTDSDTDYLNRILNYLRMPPAGGTANDYKNWALASVTVDTAIQANPPLNFTAANVDLLNNYVTVTGMNWYDTDAVQLTTTGTLPAPLAISTTYYIKRVNNDSVQFSLTSGGAAIVLTTLGTGVQTITSSDTDTYYIESATVITPNSPQPSTPGTVEVYFEAAKVGDTGSQYTNPKISQIGTSLAAAATAYIDDRRPVTASGNIVDIATPNYQNISITVSPATADVASMQTDIAAYIDSLNAGDPLYQAQLSAICLRDGAVNATVVLPAADVTPANSEVIVASSISIGVI